MDESSEQRVPLMPLTKGYLTGKGFWAYFWFAVGVQVGVGLIIGTILSLFVGVTDFFSISLITICISASIIGLIGCPLTYILSDLIGSTIGPGVLYYSAYSTALGLVATVQIALIAYILARICDSRYERVPKRLARWFVVGVLLNSVSILLFGA